jgi:hypothetical protein
MARGFMAGVMPWLVFCTAGFCVGGGRSETAGSAKVSPRTDLDTQTIVSTDGAGDAEGKLRIIPTSLGIRQANGEARPIPYLGGYAVEESSAVRHVAEAIAIHDREPASLEKQLRKNEGNIAAARAALRSAEAEISREHHTHSSDSPTNRDRDPVDKLVTAGAIKSAADREYQASRHATIDPLLLQVQQFEKMSGSPQQAIDGLRRSSIVRLFEVLPGTQARVFRTDGSERFNTTISEDSETISWAEASRVVTPWLTERYRWVLRTADDLDADGVLVLSNRTLLSDTASVLWNDWPKRFR